MSVSLRAFVDEMDVFSDEHHAYINKITGELVTLSNEEINAIEDGDDWAHYPVWQQELLQTAQRVMESNDFIELPSKHEIHEYRIIEAFCDILPDRLQNEFFSCIRGSGAFRCFKAALYRHGIEQNWFAFRRDALKDIAKQWCKDNEIQFIDDMDRRKIR